MVGFPSYYMFWKFCFTNGFKIFKMSFMSFATPCSSKPWVESSLCPLYMSSHMKSVTSSHLTCLSIVIIIIIIIISTQCVSTWLPQNFHCHSLNLINFVLDEFLLEVLCNFWYALWRNMNTKYKIKKKWIHASTFSTCICHGYLNSKGFGVWIIL